MKIIQHGIIEADVKVNSIKFKCRNCGCVFEAEEDEYYKASITSCLSYPPHVPVIASCPECHKICTEMKIELGSLEIDPIKVNLKEEL